MNSSDIAFSGTIPENYDTYLGPLLFEPYAQDLVSRIPSTNISSALEIACGTGRTTKYLRDFLPTSVSLVATDLNPDMLSVAKKRVIGKNLSWQVADFLELPFEDRSFDLVVCQFGLMFVPDKLKALQEVYRVLKPEGCFLFNTWDRLENNRLFYVGQEILNRFFKDEAPTFYHTPYSMHDMQEMGLLMGKAGFKDSEIVLAKKEGIIESAADAARGMLEGNPVFIALSEKDPTILPSLKLEFEKTFAAEFGDHPLRTQLQAWVGKAWKIS